MLQNGGLCITKSGRESRAASFIMDALILLMKKCDYEKISVSAICRKAGVTRMSFYRNFSGKEDVLLRWIGKITDDFLAESDIDYAKDDSRAYIKKLFSHMDSYRDECELIRKAGLMHLVQFHFNRCFTELHKDSYTSYKAHFHAGGIYNVFFLWLQGGCKESPDELADMLSDMMEK